MKLSTARKGVSRSAAGTLGAALALAVTIGGMAIQTASADEHGHRGGGDRGHWHGDHDHDRGHWRGGYGHGYGRRDWRGGPVYEPYPVYAPPPVYYAPEPDPGVTLFFPIEIH